MITQAESIYWGEGEYCIAVKINLKQSVIVGNTLTIKQAHVIVSQINDGFVVSDENWKKCANKELEKYDLNII